MPATYRAATAVPAAVTSVPAIPVQTMAAAAVRNRRRPMCMPPSNKMIASATVTTRSTVTTGSAVADGHSCAAMTAATRKNAGAGTRSLALSRLESTAAVPARPITENDEAELACPAHRVRLGSSPGTGQEVVIPQGPYRAACPAVRTDRYEVDDENWEKLKFDDGISMLDTLNRRLQQAELVHDVRDALDPGRVDADRVGVERHDGRRCPP